MIIRKQMKFEASHIVRACTHSRRCSFNTHGHSFIVEVMVNGLVTDLDRAHMVRDFGAFGPLKEIVDRFDHAHIIGSMDPAEYVQFIKDNNERWVSVPCNPSAEMLSCVLFDLFEQALFDVAGCALYSVRVHETATGWAQCFRSDVELACDTFCNGERLADHTVFSVPGPDTMQEVAAEQVQIGGDRHYPDPGSQGDLFSLLGTETHRLPGKGGIT